MSESAIAFEEGSGNVFEDIGFDRPTAARLAHKADLVGVLHRVQHERGLTQAAFARLSPSRASRSSTTAGSAACPPTSSSTRSRAWADMLRSA